MPKSFAQRMREIMRDELKGRDEIAIQEIAARFDFVTDKEKRPIYRSIRDFVTRGEVVRVRKGVVRYVGLKRDVRPADKTRCMWRLIRSNRNENILASDLVSNCKVSVVTAREYLRMLVRRGVLRRIDMPNNQPSKFRMIDDPGPNLVRNEENAEKLRRLREAHRAINNEMMAANELIEMAAGHIDEAKKIISNTDTLIEEEPCPPSP